MWFWIWMEWPWITQNFSQEFHNTCFNDCSLHAFNHCAILSRFYWKWTMCPSIGVFLWWKSVMIMSFKHQWIPLLQYMLLLSETTESSKTGYGRVNIACFVYIFPEHRQNTWCLNALRRLVTFRLTMVYRNTTIIKWYYINFNKHCKYAFGEQKHKCAHSLGRIYFGQHQTHITANIKHTK